MQETAMATRHRGGRTAAVAVCAITMAGLALVARPVPLNGQEPASPDAGRQGGAGPGRGRLGGPGAGQDLTGADFSPKAPILARSPEEEARGFLLPPGYRLELVAADPDLNNPAVIEWDGDGRMYVSEFRS